MDEDAEVRALLESRARALARPRRAPQREGENRRYTVFERRGLRYAVAPEAIAAVAHVVTPTRLPVTERHWLGITSLQGELLAVCDLPTLLEDLPEQPLTGFRSLNREGDLEMASAFDLVLVLHEARRELAILIDALLDTRVIDGAYLYAERSAVSGGVIEGTTDDGTRILDVAALLSEPRLSLASTHSEQGERPWHEKKSV